MGALNSGKESNKSNGRGGKRDGSGRPKGSLDKGNAALREMILLALDQAGGIDYLARTAEDHPGPFLSLIGKVLPTTLAGDPDQPLNINWPVPASRVER